MKFLHRILEALSTRPEGSLMNREPMLSFQILALATVQIIVGLVNIGLTTDKPGMHRHWTSLGVSHQLDAWYMELGLVSIFAYTFPSRCLVGFAVLMNGVGSIFSVLCFVPYTMDLTHVSVVCGWNISNPVCRFLLSVTCPLSILAVLQFSVCLTFSYLGTEVLLDWKNLNWKESGSDVEENHSVEKEVLLSTVTV